MRCATVSKPIHSFCVPSLMTSNKKVVNDACPVMCIAAWCASRSLVCVNSLVGERENLPFRSMHSKAGSVFRNPLQAMVSVDERVKGSDVVMFDV